MKIGDYVRTKSNGIQKIDDEGRINLGLIKPPFKVIKKEELLKSSPNIIDLIEVGDLIYVDIDNGYEGGIIVPRISETLKERDLFVNNIKNKTWILKGIVTYEQLRSMEYRL